MGTKRKDLEVEKQMYGVGDIDIAKRVCIDSGEYGVYEADGSRSTIGDIRDVVVIFGPEGDGDGVDARTEDVAYVGTRLPITTSICS